MSSFRFLLSRRWALFGLTVVLLVLLAWWLGNWQFDRLEQRRANNGIVSANEGAAPAPVGEVMSVDEPVAEHDEWRRITATGRYDTDDTIVWRYRSDDRGSGVDIIVPLVTDQGPTLLVDRGWLASERQTEYPEIPAPAEGTVTVTGWVRADGTGDSTKVDRMDGLWGTRAPSSQAIGPAIDQEVYRGFVQLESEDPAPATALRPNELPELDDGPHLFYGIQWWFFGALAVFGFFYLLYDERRSQVRKGTVDATAGGDGAGDGAGGGASAGSGGGEPGRQAVPSGRTERRRRREEKNAQRAAVRAAYQQAYARAAGAQSERSAPPSTGTVAPDTNDAAGESRNAATRPNSSGRP